jgi:hypothetical protein
VRYSIKADEGKQAPAPRVDAASVKGPSAK